MSFLQPRSREDLERRRIGMRQMAEYHGGVMGRAPDYLNVTFALFAARADVWARRGNERGAENLVRYYELMREHDLSTTHAIMNPQVDRSRPDAAAGAGQIALHKVGETSEGIVVRGARMLATLAPYADEISIYPGSPLRPEDTAYALCFALPMNTPGLKVVLRDSFAKPRPAFDYPLSSRFDEQDGMVIFDDVVVPWDRVFMDGDTIGYDEVISHTNWRAQIVNQAMVRAWTKLELTFGLAHAITSITGVNRFDHVQEKLGEIWSYVEMTRSGVLASEAGSYGAGPDELAWTPDERPLVALRGLMPKWIPRAFELTRLVGGAGFMATPVAGRRRRPDGRGDRAVLPGGRRRLPRAHPPLPAGLGPDRLRSRLARRALRALLPAGLLPHDGPRLPARRQDGGAGSGRPLPAGRAVAAASYDTSF